MTRKDYQDIMIKFWKDKYAANRGRERHVVGRMDAPEEEYVRDTRHIREVFGLILEEAQSVIDFGCGIGRFTDLLKKYFKSYLGVDVIKKLNNDEKFMSLESFLKRDVHADAVFTSVVLQHITDDDYVDMLFEKFAKVIPKGGRIYMNEQVGSGKIIYRRKFPYINQRERGKYIEMLSKYGFMLERDLPKDNQHRIFKFKKVV